MSNLTNMIKLFFENTFFSLDAVANKIVVTSMLLYSFFFLLRCIILLTFNVSSKMFG